MTNFLRKLSPRRAGSDLIAFLRQRRRHEVVFFVLAISLTWGIMVAMASELHVPYSYKPEIIYVQQWRDGRTDAEIIAQQKIDQPKERARRAAQAKREAEQRAVFKRLNDQMDAWHL